MRLAIVGSAKWGWAGVHARNLIADILDDQWPDVVVSGGEPEGVDYWAADAARRRGIAVVEYLPRNPRWAPEGYKERNLLIANDCDRLVCIRAKTSKTYGSGWTADRAEELGVPVERHTL